MKFFREVLGFCQYCNREEINTQGNTLCALYFPVVVLRLFSFLAWLVRVCTACFETTPRTTRLRSPAVSAIFCRVSRLGDGFLLKWATRMWICSLVKDVRRRVSSSLQTLPVKTSEKVDLIGFQNTKTITFVSRQPWQLFLVIHTVNDDMFTNEGSLSAPCPTTARFSKSNILTICFQLKSPMGEKGTRKRNIEVRKTLCKLNSWESNLKPLSKGGWQFFFVVVVLRNKREIWRRVWKKKLERSDCGPPNWKVDRLPI